MSKISIEQNVYDALCYLRDVTHEDTRAQLAQRARLVEQLEMGERASKAVINEQSVTIEHLRRKNLEQHALILKMQERLAQLEPLRSSVEQPLFARK